MSLLLLFPGLGSPQAAGDTVVSGLQRNSNGFLEFESGTLKGEFRTPNPIQDRSKSATYFEPREMFVSFFVDARQRPPYDTSVEGMSPRKEPGFERMTKEGLAWTLPDDPQGVTIRRQMRFNVGGDADNWLAWERYVGGLYKASAVQFRVQIERPDATWQAEIREAKTIVRLREPSLFDVTPQEHFARSLLHQRRRKRF